MGEAKRRGTLDERIEQSKQNEVMRREAADKQADLEYMQRRIAARDRMVGGGVVAGRRQSGIGLAALAVAVASTLADKRSKL